MCALELIIGTIIDLFSKCSVLYFFVLTIETSYYSEYMCVHVL